MDLLKKCPECGTVSSDDQAQCDMCDRNLSDVPSQTMDAIDQEHASDERREDEFEKAVQLRAAEHQLVGKVAVSVIGVLVFLGGLVLVVQFGSYLLGILIMIIGSSMILLGTKYG